MANYYEQNRQAAIEAQQASLQAELKKIEDERKRKAEADRQKEQSEVASRKVVRAYLNRAMTIGLLKGSVDPKIAQAFYEFTSEDERVNEYLKAYNRLLTHPINGVTRSADGFSYQGQNLKTLEDVHYAIDRQLGEPDYLPNPDFIYVLYENSLEGTALEYGEFVRVKQAGSTPSDLGSDRLTMSDAFRLQSLGLLDVI